MMKTIHFRSTMALVCAMVFCSVSTSVQAQTHEIKQELMDGQGWFGGDDRPANRRTVGAGQLVLMDANMTINSFAFHYGAPFDFAQNPVGSGHDVTLRLHVRDRAGVILKTTEVAVPASFTSGWVTWEGLNLAVTSGVKLFFTAYLVGGFDANPYYSSYSASTSNPYSDGSVVLKDGQSDADLDNWTDWVPNSSWDAAFRLVGTQTTTGIGAVLSSSTPDIQLLQNHPNPVRDRTNFEFSISRSASVRLEIYSLLGARLYTLLDADLPSGSHRVDWNNTTLRNGMYAVVLRAGTASITRMMTVLR